VWVPPEQAWEAGHPLQETQATPAPQRRPARITRAHVQNPVRYSAVLMDGKTKKSPAKCGASLTLALTDPLRWKEWKPSRPYHVALEDSYIRVRWEEINALCKLNNIPFSSTGEKIRHEGLSSPGSWTPYNFGTGSKGDGCSAANFTIRVRRICRKTAEESADVRFAESKEPSTSAISIHRQEPSGNHRAVSNRE
jgi:hypothetical protein